MDTITGCVRDCGFEMSYCCFGDGSKVLVVIPGLSLLAISPMANSLSVKYRIYRNDYKVYFFDRKTNITQGYTIEQMADDTALAMRKLGIANAHIIGHSQGGMIAQVIASKYPHLVDKLVLCATTAQHKSINSSRIDKWKNLAQAGDVVTLNHDIYTHVYSQDFYNKAIDIFTAIESLGTAEDLEQFIYKAQASLEFNTSAFLPNIKCSTLVIGSLIDNTIDCNETIELAHTLGSKLIMLDNSGHNALDEVPDVHNKIYNFLQSND